jgi:hypothetical protein
MLSMQHTLRKIILILFLLPSITANSQVIGSQDRIVLMQKEDSLKQVAAKIVMSREAGERFRSDSLFTRMLVRALKVPNSFLYPFDSIIHISKLYAPDSAFRIFTWQVVRDESMSRRHGAIQVRTTDGSLKLFPLIDRTLVISHPIDTVTSNEWWIGSIYYKIIQKENRDAKYYTLLGYDENTMRSTKKRIEVLSFDASGKPVFGGPFISFEEDTLRKPMQARFWIEYKKEGNARLQFDDDMDMIIYDHLIPENNEADKKYTYIPDGDYEGFKWKEGRWVHVDKVFNFKLKDGEAPVIAPLTEDKLGGKTPPSNTPAKNSKKKSGGG